MQQAFSTSSLFLEMLRTGQDSEYSLDGLVILLQTIPERHSAAVPFDLIAHTLE